MSMWKSLPLLGLTIALFLGADPYARAQSTEPILRIELGTHSASLFAIAADPSQHILVTGSEDKTVRVWDISDHARLLRTLRPPVGDLEQGHIFAVALSTDGKTVACGGRTGAPQRGDGCVYLFDRHTGELTRRIGGLPGWVQDLKYTADGRYLAVTTGERGGRASWAGLSLFRLPDYRLVAQDRDYENFNRWIAGDPTGAMLATSSFDGFVRLYNLAGLNTGHEALPMPITPVSKIRPPGGQLPWGLAFSPNGAWLAVGFNMTPKVDVLHVRGNNLEPAFSPDTTGITGGKEIDFRTVAWSSDGRFLYAGGGARVKKDRLVRKWADAGQGSYRDLRVEVDLPIHRIIPLAGIGLAYASRDGTFGVLTERDETMLLSPRTIPIYAANEEGLLLTSDAKSVQFAFERHGRSPALFAVNQRQLSDSSSMLWNRLKANTSFQAPITRGIPVTDWQTSMTPKLNGRPLKLKQEVAKCLAIKPDLTGFLLGTTNSLWYFDSAGAELWRIRMPGVVWGVNTNGSLAIAALGDGTIRWYRLADGRELLALFPHPDRKRWILWTPAGYFDASAGGEDFIGWHVNNGVERAADFFAVSRFRDAYFRPDVIDRVLDVLDEDQAIGLANENSGRNQATSVREKLPPVVTILSPADGKEISEPSLAIRYSIRSQEPVTSLKVLVDGRPVFKTDQEWKSETSGEISVNLPNRDCKVSLIATNRQSISEPATISLRYKGVAAGGEFQIKPNLYVLAVGVSAYQDPDLRLDLAAKDALDFGASWIAQKGRLYDNVDVRTLADAQATKGNVLDSLEWLQRQVTSKDIAVLFFAGHGINDSSGEFYFLPVDADMEKLKRTGVSQFDITSTVAGIAGKVLVFMDACHSGNLMSSSKRRGLVVVSAVINEMASAESGAVVFSSATGRQYALENKEWGNGAFTKSVVEGLEGRADFTASGRITLNMLDLYISERVKELTLGQQSPTTVKPPNVPDFPVAMVR